MNIQLPDSKQFNIKDVIVAGDECVLVTPKDMGVEWTDENKFFRSSIWRKSDMKPVSLGFRKFTNYGEKPSFEPIENSTCVRAIQKIDGSCLIVSNYKDELIIRTRGTVDATKLENGHEIEFLKKKYPKAFDNTFLECGLWTLLFEWTTPTNRIVLKESNEPTLWLIGMVFHGDYSYAYQHNLDQYAKEMGVERPKSFGINLGAGIEDLKKGVEPLQDVEGVVIYDETPGDSFNQTMKKIKTLRYLQLHRVFTGVKTVDHLFNLFAEYGCTYRENFETLLATNFDWELVATLKDLLDQLYTKWSTIKMRVAWIELYFLNPDFIEMNRKDKAQKILEYFPDCSGIAFALLDKKAISPAKLWETFKTN